MKINVLISCMREKDTSIIERSNVQTDVVVVNQCDTDSETEFDFVNKKGKSCHAKFINTTERGLSRSRNMALNNAWGDICLISDDDEYFDDEYEELILQGYCDYDNADVIAFAIEDGHHVFPKESKRLDFITILRSNSQQISFKRDIIKTKGISFDVKMGSGTGNGGGEEIKFLLACKKNNLKMYYHPNCITTVSQKESQWFHGYTDNYFVNFGWTSRRLFGAFIGMSYIFYFMLSHRNQIKKDNTIKSALKHSLKGWKEKR